MNQKNYRWYSFITAVFVTTLVISNIIAVKVTQFSILGFSDLILPAAVILFPIAYIFGDILTEVYGYAKARQVIWIGFFCNLLAVVAIWVAGLLPAAPFWNAGIYESSEAAQQAYLAIFSRTPLLLVASFLAYLVGEFLNSYVMAKLKVRTEGRFLWLRTITSTIVGQGVDSAIFITIAFGGIPGFNLPVAITSQWLFKVAFEVLATPLTYVIVKALKRAENEDFYDRDTNFNPVGLSR